MCIILPFTVRNYFVCLWIQDKADRRKQLLVDSLEAQQYFTEAQETELWMKDMEPLVGSTDYGKDEDMAEVCVSIGLCIKECTGID